MPLFLIYVLAQFFLQFAEQNRVTLHLASGCQKAVTLGVLQEWTPVSDQCCPCCLVFLELGHHTQSLFKLAQNSLPPPRIPANKKLSQLSPRNIIPRCNKVIIKGPNGIFRRSSLDYQAHFYKLKNWRVLGRPMPPVDKYVPENNPTCNFDHYCISLS